MGDLSGNGDLVMIKYRMDMIEDRLLHDTILAIESAGRIIRSSSPEKARIEKKSEKNYVTEIDIRVQNELCEALLKILPDSNIIAEESEHNLYNLEKPTWVLDPVDGTTNLIHDLRHSAVSLALYIDGKSQYAYIYNPYLDEMFYCKKGHGAWLNDKRINVTASRRFADCLVAFGTTPYDRREAGRTFEIVQQVFMQSREIRRTGSAALDLAYVAAGRFDAFFEKQLQPWDYAAGLLLLTEAGGAYSNWQGEHFEKLEPNGIVAANPYVHEILLSIVQGR